MTGGVNCPWKGDNWGDITGEMEEVGEARFEEVWESGEIWGDSGCAHLIGVDFPSGDTSGDDIDWASRDKLWLSRDRSILVLESSTFSSPCCVSAWRLRSTFLWNDLPHLSHPKGLNPVCFLQWVMRLDDWLKALPQWLHLYGFSPAIQNQKCRKMFRNTQNTIKF